MSDCIRIDCANRSKCCYKCFDSTFYKKPKVIKQLGSNARKKVKNTDDSWKELESRVARDLSNIPEYYDTRRQIQSGAKWYATGDVSDNIVHVEAKERIGNEVISRGTKSFTISKDWLDKSVIEADIIDKPTFLTFRFKNDSTIHVISQWKYIADLVCTVKSLMIENDRKDVIIAELAKRLNKSQ